jgi:hypothetical protein
MGADIQDTADHSDPWGNTTADNRLGRGCDREVALEMTSFGALPHQRFLRHPRPNLLSAVAPPPSAPIRAIRGPSFPYPRPSALSAVLPLPIRAHPRRDR